MSEAEKGRSRLRREAFKQVVRPGVERVRCPTGMHGWDPARIGSAARAAGEARGRGGGAWRLLEATSARYHLGVPEISLPEAIAVVVVATAAYVWRRALGDIYEAVRDWLLSKMRTEAALPEGPNPPAPEVELDLDEALGENADLEYELEEDEWTILEILTVAGGEQVGNHAIERGLSDLSAIRVRHHLDQLVRLELVRETHTRNQYMAVAGGDHWYQLTRKGREFVVEHDLDE